MSEDDENWFRARATMNEAWEKAKQDLYDNANGCTIYHEVTPDTLTCRKCEEHFLQIRETLLNNKLD